MQTQMKMVTALRILTKRSHAVRSKVAPVSFLLTPQKQRNFRTVTEVALILAKGRNKEHTPWFTKPITTSPVFFMRLKMSG